MLLGIGSTNAPDALHADSQRSKRSSCVDLSIEVCVHRDHITQIVGDVAVINERASVGDIGVRANCALKRVGPGKQGISADL